MRIHKVHRYIFLLLVFLIPVNLGKHYIIKDAYVYGLLVDYLIPTVYIQDILVLLLIFLWIIDLIKHKSMKSVFLSKQGQILILFLFSILLSVISSKLMIPSLESFIRSLLYSMVFLYVGTEVNSQNKVRNALTMFISSSFLVSVLGIFQFVKQGAVFNNYLFFGEQPYSNLTKGLTREFIFGRYLIPSYGLFRHPNAFAGYLVIVITWVLIILLKKIDISTNDNKISLRLDIFKGRNYMLYVFGMLISIVALLFTFSVVSYICLIISFILLILFWTKWFYKVFYIFSIGTFVVSLSLPVFRESPFISSHPSFYRRADLLSSAYTLIKSNKLFGVGYGISPAVIEDSMRIFTSVRFAQPVHNIFILIFSESGIFSFVLFVLLIFYIIRICRRENPVLLIYIFQLIFLGSFDHYLFTMHQTHLLMWITLGMCLIRVPVYDYNKRDA